MTYADRIPAPRPIPNMSARLADARRCGHTPEQHRHDDGQDADAASRDRAIRELTAELDRTRDERNERLTLAESSRLAKRYDQAEEARNVLRAQLDAIKNRHPGDALADALRNAYTPGQLALLHERTVDQLDDDAPREDPLGRLVDALFAAAHQKPSAGLGSPSPRAQDDRTRIEDAIEKRLREAWPNWPIDDVWLEQVAAQAALAVVEARL